MASDICTALRDGGSGAIISPCERYRYLLWRQVRHEGDAVLFVMLNPSTADAMTDDPTIRKCVTIARREGFGKLLVANLFAWRATDPAELARVIDPVGPQNDAWLEPAALGAHRVVFAWGANRSKMVAARSAHVYQLLRDTCRGKLAVLGRTKDGSPPHPLYLPNTRALESYP